MKRRGFLGALAALVAAPTLVKADVRPAVDPAHHAPLLNPIYRSFDPVNQYMHVQADRDVAVGDFVFRDNVLVGYALLPIRKNEFGWIQLKDTFSR